ncbi:MAG: GtrA family protein [Patescibacteria group bacterium]
MNRLKELFLDKKFIYYTWIAVFISLLNVFLLWLLIDNFHIPTIISGFIVMIVTFVLRYLLYDFSKVL